MARSNPDKLAQALRANLVRRKERARAVPADDATVAEPTPKKMPKGATPPLEVEIT